MHLKRLLAAAAIAGACASAQAVTLVSSTFDAGTDGWTVINGAQALTWVADGGDPGGYITATDKSPRSTWIWAAPDWFIGNWSTAFGGTLSFALNVTRAGSGGDDLPDIKLSGGGIDLVIDTGASPAPGGWVPFVVALAPGNWHIGSLTGALAKAADISTVLSNVTSLHIRGEFGVIEHDSGSLDSVAVTSAVPEPGPWALWLAGGAVVGSLALRRR